MKKFYLVMAALLVSVSMFADKISGSLGDDLTWEFENGTLTIKGSGDMPTVDKYTSAWHKGDNGNTGGKMATSDIKKVVVEEGVTSLGKYAFYGLGELTEVKLPSTLTVIGEDAFEDCKKLTSIVLPDAVEEIHAQAFYRCVKLATVTFSKNLKTIGINAFSTDAGNMALTSIDLSKTQVETICGGAFGLNTELKTVHLPKTLLGFYGMGFTGDKQYGEGAFQGCSNIEKVIIDATDVPETDPYAADNYDFPFRDAQNAQLVVPKGSEEAYKKAGWDKYFKSMTTTGIRNLAKNTAMQAVDVYTLAGTKRLSHATVEEINALPKGVYIANGKKVLIK